MLSVIPNPVQSYLEKKTIRNVHKHVFKKLMHEMYNTAKMVLV